MTSSDPLRLVGRTLAHKYAMESLVRAEAGSVVYRATHLASNRSAGVRVLTSLASVAEARRSALFASLAHDQAKLAELAGIVPAAWPIREVGSVIVPSRAEGLESETWVPFVALAWPHGVTLRQLLLGVDALPETPAEIAALIEPVAVALAIAHEHGVVHGGITPERILFRDDARDGVRRPVLLDFGVARVLRAAGAEDATGDATAEDDVRALAGVLSIAIARACGADAKIDVARSPRERGASVDDAVEEVFARALSGDSFASVGDFWAELRRALRLAPLRSLEATIPPEVPAPSTRSLRPTAHSAPPPPPERTALGSRVAYAATALGVLALAGITLARAGAWGGAHDAAAASAAAPPVVTGPACPAGMIAVRAATFHTGVAGEADDPQRDVTLRAFCIDRDAVTTADYKACSDRGDCKRASRTNEWEGITPVEHDALDPQCTSRDPVASAARPVNCVTWEMASTYCAERGARLPTEAEWAVATGATSADIAEWVADWEAPIAAGEPQVDPRGPTSGDERVVRGAHAPAAPASRFGAAPTTRSHAIGFRCATTP